jgi:hypothetical protein
MDRQEITTMDRKVYVTVTTRLIINADRGVYIDDVIAEMDYNFTSNTEGAEIVDTEIVDAEITRSEFIK